MPYSSEADTIRNQIEEIDIQIAKLEPPRTQSPVQVQSLPPLPTTNAKELAGDCRVLKALRNGDAKKLELARPGSRKGKKLIRKIQRLDREIAQYAPFLQ